MAPAIRTERRRGQGGVVRGGLILLATVALAYAAFTGAVANVARSVRPEIALRFSPGNGGAWAYQADQTATVAQGKASAQAASQAMNAVRRSPLSARAVRVLALRAAAVGDERRLSALLMLASRISRRDTATQLMLIESGVAQGKIDLALTHYDIALRVAPDLSVALFPILTEAAVETPVRNGLVKTLRTNPPWAYAFFYQAARGGDPRTVAAIVNHTGGLLTGDRYRPLQDQLVSRLIDAGAFADARSVYRLARRGADRRWNEIAFTAADADQSDPASWRLIATDEMQAELTTGASNSFRLHLGVPVGRTGALARKTVFLAPGAYRVSDATPTYAAGARLEWALRCPGRALAGIAWTDIAPLRNGTTIEIPDNCPAQSIELTATAGTVADLDTDVAAPELRRVAGHE